MKHIFFTALICFVGIPLQSNADDAPLILELFTSQGCSSCPRADRLLGELATRKNVIALSCHVTYWNYLGWKDSFSLEACDNRQGNYRRQFRLPSNYTPQLVINGQFETVGSNAEKVDRFIQAASQAEIKALNLQRTGKGFTADVSTITDTPSLEFIVFYLDETKKVAVNRGENEGRTLEYHNPVLSIVKLDHKKIRNKTVIIDSVPDTKFKSVLLVAQNQLGHIVAAGIL